LGAGVKKTYKRRKRQRKPSPSTQGGADQNHSGVRGQRKKKGKGLLFQVAGCLNRREGSEGFRRIKFLYGPGMMKAHRGKDVRGQEKKDKGRKGAKKSVDRRRGLAIPSTNLTKTRWGGL